MACTVPRAVRRVYPVTPNDVDLTDVARARHPRAAFWFHTTRRGYRSVVICYLCDRLVIGWNGGSAPPQAVGAQLVVHRIHEWIARLG